MPRNQRIPVVLRHGLVARCAGAVAGACRVSVVRDRRTLAAVSQNVPAGRLGTLHANFNRRGRALLRHARGVAVTVRVRPPGAAGRSLRVTLRR